MPVILASLWLIHSFKKSIHCSVYILLNRSYVFYQSTQVDWLFFCKQTACKYYQLLQMYHEKYTEISYSSWSLPGLSYFRVSSDDWTWVRDRVQDMLCRRLRRARSSSKQWSWLVSQTVNIRSLHGQLMCASCIAEQSRFEIDFCTDAPPSSTLPIGPCMHPLAPVRTGEISSLQFSNFCCDFSLNVMVRISALLHIYGAFNFCENWLDHGDH